MCGRSLCFWITCSNIDQFRLDVYNYLNHNQSDITIKGLERMMLEYLRTFGFLDYIHIAMCKPGSGPVNPDDERISEM